MGLGLLGIDRQRDGKFGERVIDPAKPGVGRAEVLMRVRIVGMKVHSPGVGIDRRVEVLPRGADGAHRLIDPVQARAADRT